MIFSHYVKCLNILGITWNDWWSQALREMPEYFRHYAKCLVSQIACNIYATEWKSISKLDNTAYWQLTHNFQANMPYCPAFGCNSSTVIKITGLHFHKFPSDKLRRKQWILYCRRAGLSKVSTYRCLCSRHFSKKCYEKDPEFMARNGYPNARPKLFKDAVPDVPLNIPTCATSSRANPTMTERGACK